MKSTGTNGSKPPEAAALDKLRALPPFSAVATYLFELVSHEDIGLNKLAEIIRADARLSKDMLQIANSALFGGRNPVTGVLHATVMLGLARVRALVTTAAVKDFLGPARGMPAVVRSWRHNLACALLCEEISRRANLDRDFAYTAGLLHDIGRLAMLRAWLKEYSALLDAAEPCASAVLQKEFEAFGLRHTRAGSVLIEGWGLPPVFAEIAGRHHTPPQADQAGIQALVHYSCSLASHLGFSSEGQPPPDPCPEPQEASPFRGMIGGSLDDIRYRLAEKINDLECCLTS